MDAVTVRLREGESFDSLLRRFDEEVMESGVLKDGRHRRWCIPKDEPGRMGERRGRRRARIRCVREQQGEKLATGTNASSASPSVAIMQVDSIKEEISAMSTRLFVGNLSFQTTEEDLRPLFAGIGNVASVTLVTDRYSGRSKGFAFVEMAAPEDAQKAISALNGQILHDRTIRVDLARPREARRRVAADTAAPSVEPVTNPAADRPSQSNEIRPSGQS